MYLAQRYVVQCTPLSNILFFQTSGTSGFWSSYKRTNDNILNPFADPDFCPDPRDPDLPGTNFVLTFSNKNIFTK
jgi:hypothetical protein